MPKVNANTIRVGNVVEINGKLFAVMKTQMVQPGKGGAFAQFELRGVKDGVKTQERYRSQEQVERVSLEDRDYQYLYAEGDNLAFMDTETFEQLHVPRELIGDPAVWLQEGMICNIRTYEGAPVAAELPQQVTLRIVEADPVVKGQTASSSFKPALLENGQKVLVPPHIESGTRVVVSTADGAYVERAKD